MRKGLTVLAVLIVVGLIAGGIFRWLGSNNGPDQLLPPGQPPETTTEAEQPEWCPDVEVISAPGTWESASWDDPANPTFNPASYMLSITQPLQASYPADDVKVWTLPYVAQFRNINSLAEATYDDSRAEGSTRVEDELRTMHEQCPKTDFLLMGFSQGAVILGDLASAIGQDERPIPAERVRGVALVADGRREAGVGQAVGNPVAGVGAEISLAAVSALVQPIVPGATMRGPRSGGFGSLNDRTFEICAPDDNICDAPLGVPNALERAQSLIAANGVHAQYATNPNVIPGSTATEWMLGWAHGAINGGA